MAFRFVVICALLATAYGADLLSLDRISGGRDVTIRAAPWQVSLQGADGHFCGGVIITRKHILTAASCLQDPEVVESLRLRVGSTYHDVGGVLKAVRHIMVHDNFSSPVENDNDIAVLTLQFPLTFSENVRRIALITPDTQLPANATVVLTGWDTAENEQSFSNNVLQGAPFQVVDHSECVSAHGQLDGQPRVTDNMICAASPQAGTYSEDAGNPLVVIAYQGVALYGLSSWGGCSDNSHPEVFTRVNRYIDWIRSCNCDV